MEAAGRQDHLPLRRHPWDITKLKRDVPDYLYGIGSRGNVIVFDATELEKFLQISLSHRNGYLRSLARLLGR
jgi:hypothetical protein